MDLRQTFYTLFALLAFTVIALSPASAQDRDVRSHRLVLDDNGGGGTWNSMVLIADPLLAGDRILTIPDPGPTGGEFVLSSGGTVGFTEIETPNVNETLRINPSGDLVQIGNSASPGTSNGLEVYGSMTVQGPDITMVSSTAGGAGIGIQGQDINVGARTLLIKVTETVTIQGNLVVNGNLDVYGRLNAHNNNNVIGSGNNAPQLRVQGLSGGSADHLYVVGNVRLTDELRIGTGNNTSIFQTGTQSAAITYTLPTSLPATAASGTSMGNGVMETDASGSMTWRNSGTASSSLDFPSTNDDTTSTLTVALTGAAVGDLVILGTPTPAVGTWYDAWVSAADTVTIRFHNNSGAALDPSSDTFNVMVMRP